MKIINIIKEWYKDAKSSFLTALICTITNVLGQYLNYDFDFIQIDNFKISFDCLLFIVLIFGISGWVIWGYYIFLKVVVWYNKRSLLQTIKNCNVKEKDFLYSRVYNNYNEKIIDMKCDSYFYNSEKDIINGISYQLKAKFGTLEKVIKFLRKLENKGILEYGGDKHMRIPEIVWDILTKNSDEIFKN